MRYRDALPPNCPPPGAEEIAERRTVHHFARRLSPTPQDFRSQRQRRPEADRSASDECIAAGLSVFAESGQDGRHAAPRLLHAPHHLPGRTRPRPRRDPEDPRRIPLHLAAGGGLGHRRLLFESATMPTLTHVQTFIHADGPVEFEARDADGRSYLAGLVEYRDEGDVFIVVPASEDEIAAVAAGSADACQLFLTNGATPWYLSEPYAGAGAFRAYRQSIPISEYTNDRDPGFSLMQAHEFTRADLPTAARSAAGKRHRFVADGQSSTTLVHYGQGDQDGDQQADRIQGTTRQGSAPDMRRGVVEL